MVTTVSLVTEGGGAAGDRYTIVARPSLPVEIVLDDSTPKSTGTPPTLISARRVSPLTGWLEASRAITSMADCDWPSCVMVSGVAVTASDRPELGRTRERRRRLFVE